MKNVFRTVLEVFLSILTFIIAVLIFVGIAWSITNFDLVYQEHFAPKYAEVKRETFKESKSYVEGMVNDLADYKREYERTTDEAEKQQVLNYIDSHFANFDASNIENQTLYKFLMDVRNGNLK